MIGIKVNGEFLDLFPGVQVSFKLANPIFAEDNIIPGSYTWPFDIPGGEASPKNSRLLSHPDIAETFGNFRKIAAEVYIQNNLFRSGQLIIQEATPSVIKVSFVFGLGEFAEQMKNTSIKEIIDESITWDATAYTKKITLTYVLQNSPFELEVNGKVYTGADMQALTDAINAETELPRATAVYTDNGTTGGSGAAAVGDTIELTPRDEPTSLESELTVKGDGRVWDVAFNASEYFNPIQTALATYFTATPPDNKIRFPMVVNNHFKRIYANSIQVDGSPASLDLWVNHNIDGVLKQNTAGGGADLLGFDFGNHFSVYNSNILSPFVMVRHILSKIATYYGFTISGDFLTTDTWLNGLVFHSKKLFTEVPLMGDIPFIFWHKTINLKDLVPDISAGEFLKALQTRFNLAVYYDERRKRLVMNSRDKIVNNKILIDITDESGLLSPVLPSALEGVMLEADQDADDALSVPDKYLKGTNADQTIRTPISGLSQNQQQPFGSLLFTVPVCDVENSEALRLIFYTGRKNLTGKATQYTSASVDPSEGVFAFAQAFARDWVHYIRFLLERKEIRTTAHLSLGTIISLDYEQKYRIGPNNYLIKEVDVILTSKGLQASALSLYKTPS